jgi:hypothetical protein
MHYSCGRVGKWCLVDGDQLEVKHKLRVGGDSRHAFAAVCEMSRNGDSALTTSTHALNANVPALNDLAATKLELKRLALGIRYGMLESE